MGRKEKCDRTEKNVKYTINSGDTGREKNKALVYQEERPFQFAGKKRKKDIILAPFPSTTFVSSRIKPGVFHVQQQKALG